MWLLALAIEVSVAPAALAAQAVRAQEDAAFERARAWDHAGSTGLLMKLYEQHPGSERACLWQERVVLDAVAGGDPTTMWRAAEALVDRWHELGGGEATALQRVCRNDVASTLQYLAARWHIEGDEACDAGRIELAERAYRRFIAEFSDEPEVAEAEYQLAMLLMARAELAVPGRTCKGLVCGRAVRAGRAERRRRGERLGCGVQGSAEGEAAVCPWLRAAQVAFVRVLELDSDGRRVPAAAYGQLAMTSAITSHHERERGELCRTNPEGVCVVPGAQPRGPACFEPTAECLAHLGRRDRWPSSPHGGFARTTPLWRMP